MKIFNISRALGLPVSEGICTPASAPAMWQQSAHKSGVKAGVLGRERTTGLLIERPELVSVDGAPTNDNYTNALSAHQVRRLLPTP